jgi:hypothetical protein
MRMLLIAATIALGLAGTVAASAETVIVKYRGPVDLAPFTCTAIPDSSFVHRACYDAPNSYMLIQLNAVWYHYCGLDPATWDGLLGAASQGRFYDQNIKGNFDCRITPPPAY